MSKNSLLVFVHCVIGLLVACTDNYRENRYKVDPEDIYFDYNVIGDEESNNITVKLQYRIGGPDGRTRFIPDGGKVEFDGEEVKADSSKMNGIWYEVIKPLNAFGGEHVIVFTNSERVYKEVFEFKAISLKKKVPAVINRGDLVFVLDGLDTVAYIRVLLTDTAFYSRGIDRLDTVRDGRISISLSDLDNLKDGPVTIEFYRETEKELTETPDTGGRLAISYGLRRVFKLTDSVNPSSPEKRKTDVQ